MRKYKVITLCGSTKFKDEFMQVQKELTLKGYIGTSTWSEICYARMLQNNLAIMPIVFHRPFLRIFQHLLNFFYRQFRFHHIHNFQQLLLFHRCHIL